MKTARPTGIRSGRAGPTEARGVPDTRSPRGLAGRVAGGGVAPPRPTRFLATAWGILSPDDPAGADPWSCGTPAAVGPSWPAAGAVIAAGRCDRHAAQKVVMG